MKVTCGMFLIDNKGRVLTCHPTGHKPSQWDIPKGQPNEGESYIDAVIRELKEETGFDAKNYKNDIVDISGTYGTFVYKHKKKELYAFLLRLRHHSIDIAELKCESMVEIEGRQSFPEVDAYAWISFYERQMLHETQQRVLDVIKNEYRMFISEPEIILGAGFELSNIVKDNNYG